MVFNTSWFEEDYAAVNGECRLEGDFGTDAVLIFDATGLSRGDSR